MKSGYLKDCKRMFKNNLSRFISIVLIIMLGTSFFVGMNAISPDMQATAEKYMDDQNIYDISFISNLGYEKEDIEKFKSNNNIANAQGLYTADVLAKFDDKDIVVRLISSNEQDELNKNQIIDGRNIENEKECLMDQRLQTMYNYKIGDTIKVYRKDDVNLKSFIKYDEYKIVGVVRKPTFLSKFYGKTELAMGEVHSYLILNETSFNMDKYTAMYIKTNIDSNIDHFSDEYKEKLDDIYDSIVKTNNEIQNKKYKKIYDDNSKKISDYQGKIEKAEEILKKEKTELINKQNEVNNYISTIISFVNNDDKIFEKSNKIEELYNSLNKLNNEKVSNEEKNIQINAEKDKIKKEINKLENQIDKNLFEAFDTKDEFEYVKLNKELNDLYIDFNNDKNKLEKVQQDYNNNLKKLNKNETEISKINTEIEKIQEELYKTFYEAESKVNSSGNEQLKILYSDLKNSIKEIKNAQSEYKKGDYDSIIKKAKDYLQEQKQELSTFKVINDVTKIYESNSFKALKDDLNKMKIMGRIFPVMFFVVATLVTITTITRMIEDDRKNLGTLKALGYGKFKILSRYLIYSILASMIGVVIGIVIGSIAIVEVLFIAYGSLYDLPALTTRTNIFVNLLVIIISLISVVFVTLIITLKELNENAAALMRPKNVQVGKNIFLEKITFLWRKLDFLFKISFRNIFRYKKRLFMTLVGIAGCTALIYAGLSIQTSVDDIGKKQFSEIRVLNIETFLNQEKNSKDSSKIAEYIIKQEHVKDATPARQQSFTVASKSYDKEVFYMAVDGGKINDYINLKERKSQDRINLTDDGVVLTEKLANLLKVDKDARIKIIDSEAGIEVYVKVLGVTENYLYNYVYLTPALYEKIYGEEIKYNEIFVNTDDLTEEQENILAEKIKENKDVASITLERKYNDEFQTSLTSLTMIVILFIGCASLLSFIVLINLNNINIEERKRELSTIKLLGFYQKEMESYVFRENIILTIMGVILGIILGVVILGSCIQSAEVETIFLSKEANIINMVIAGIVTIVFTLITNFFMKKKIKNIDMIDSLKSVE